MKAALLGLAVPPASHSRLQPRASSPSWSERLHAQLRSADPAEVDIEFIALLTGAWENS